MAGHSPSKTGVNALSSQPSTPSLCPSPLAGEGRVGALWPLVFDLTCVWTRPASAILRPNPLHRHTCRLGRSRPGEHRPGLTNGCGGASVLRAATRPCPNPAGGGFAGMVIAPSSGTVNRIAPFSRSADGARVLGSFAIHLACPVHTSFIAMLKLPFKVERS